MNHLQSEQLAVAWALFAAGLIVGAVVSWAAGRTAPRRPLPGLTAEEFKAKYGVDPATFNFNWQGPADSLRATQKYIDSVCPLDPWPEFKPLERTIKGPSSGPTKGHTRGLEGASGCQD